VPIGMNPHDFSIGWRRAGRHFQRRLGDLLVDFIRFRFCRADGICLRLWFWV